MPTRITKQTFDAYMFGLRSIGDSNKWQDVSYWATQSAEALAALFYVADVDSFLGALFLRDDHSRFRPFPPLILFRTKRAGEASIIEKLASIEAQKTPLKRPDIEGGPGVDLFTVTHDTPLNPIFENLRDSESSKAAREMLVEVAHWFEDRDGNFVRDFQTTGTNARLWELYLFRAFRDLGFEIDQSNASPDFALIKDDLKMFVEATTANSADQKYIDLRAGPKPPPKDFWSFIENDMPIIFGSPLFTKQKKSYWEKEPVKGHPFAIAIADFHAPGSMTWSHTALSIYLYGVSVDRITGLDGKEVAVSKPLKKHKKGTKEIPAGFFEQPGTEHISAIIFSNAGTKAKVTRMGTLAGFGDPSIAVRRMGILSNPEPGALEGIDFDINIENPEYHERWRDELEIYHNPNALIPWPDESVIPGATHFKKEDGEYVWRGEGLRVLTSITKVEKRPPYSDADQAV